MDDGKEDGAGDGFNNELETTTHLSKHYLPAVVFFHLAARLNYFAPIISPLHDISGHVVKTVKKLIPKLMKQ